MRFLVSWTLLQEHRIERYSAARPPCESLMSNSRDGCKGPVQEKKKKNCKAADS